MSRTTTQPGNPPAHPPVPQATGGPSMGPRFIPYHPAQATGGAPHYRQPPGYPPPGLIHRPPPDPMETMAQRFSQTMLEILSSQQAHNETRMNRIETNIQRAVSDASDSRRETRESLAGSIVQIAEVLGKSHEILEARLKRLELVLGMGPDMKDEKTLLARFDLLSFAVEELLERLKDPEANLPDGPIHHDMATSPIKGIYADAGVVPRTPSPSPHLSSVAVGPSPKNDTISEDNSPSENNSMSTIVGDESLPVIFGKPLSHKDGQNEGRIDQQTDNDELFAALVPRAINKHTFAAASPVTRPLVPADWNDQSPSPRSFAFNPDESPEGMKPYSALPIQPPPSDGTIASLRHATFGDWVSGPLEISTPYGSTSVHPMSPALSVSPSQSPRQSTPSLTGLIDAALSLREDDAPLAAAHDHFVPPEQTPPTLTRESSVDAQLPRPSSAAPRSPTPSRAATVEPTESPSADTIREELSVRNMMSPQSDAHSNVLSPVLPLPSADIEPTLPSSVTPSPMLGAQFPASSPPQLTLEIPDRPPTPSRSSAGELFDPFMSPLSASTPSEPPSPLPKTETMEGRIPVTSSPPSGRPTVSGLRLRAPDLTGAPPTEAVTKKRKAKPQAPESGSTQEPPLKRTRQPSNNRDAGPSNVKKEKGKKRKKLNDLEWPEIIPDDAAPSEYVGKFIGCDNCERWFHYTCMAIVRGDSRLEGTFHCPFCVAGHPQLKPSESEAVAEQCSRPQCPVPDKDYEVEGVYGRYTKLDSSHGRLVYWLVFWKGYPWRDATWQTFAPEEVVEEFYRRASAQGFDTEDDSVSCIMLSEAREGGAMNP